MTHRRLIITFLSFIPLVASSQARSIEYDRQKWYLIAESGPIDALYNNNEFSKDMQNFFEPNWNVSVMRKLKFENANNQFWVEAGIKGWGHGPKDSLLRPYINEQLTAQSVTVFGELYTNNWSEFGVYSRFSIQRQLSPKFSVMSSAGLELIFTQRYNPIFEYSNDSLVFGSFRSNAGLSISADVGILYQLPGELERAMVGLAYELNAGRVRDEFTVHYGTGYDYQNYESYEYSAPFILFRQRVKFKLLFCLDW
jgi:hypothetical protein